MGYLSFQIIVFLLLAALLGFVIGWLLRGVRFQSELQDLDGRWRTKLGEVEGERDRFVAELTQANEAKTRLEASANEARTLAERHERSLQEARREHAAKVAGFAEQESQAAGLRTELGRATERAAGLEGEVRAAREADAACRSEVARLQARVEELERSGGSAASRGGGAIGLVGGTARDVAAAGGDPAGSSASAAGSAPETSSGGARLRGVAGGAGPAEPGYGQASPAHLAELGGQDVAGAGAEQVEPGGEPEGVRPEALSEARGGQADDLKRISGIGPKLERTLNGLGIFHFSQIAAFSRDNAAWVDRHLRFKGRIDREQWIEQARILAAGGETEFSGRKR